MENQAKAKRYNVTGVVGAVVERPMAGGGRFATFEIAREGKRPVACVAFADKADAFLAQFGEGATAKVFGVYEKRVVTKGEETRTYNRFRVLWSGEPTAAQPETAEEIEPQASAA